MSFLTYSQSINVHKTDGSTQSFILSEIDSITFSISNSTCPGTPTVYYEGKTYNTVLIGDQCWLKQNLDVGTRIDGSQNASDNGVIEKYCYDNNPANCETYGGLYQWYEAMQYVTNEGAQGICPDGWHIPTYSEFQTLANTVNNDGNALKKEDQGSGAGQGTNTSGFSALLCGFKYFNSDTFLNLGAETFYWASSEQVYSYADGLYLKGIDNSIYVGSLSEKEFGFSVRCIKN